MTEAGQLNHELRNAGADIHLACGALRRAVVHCPGDGDSLKLIIQFLEIASKFVALLARFHELERPEITCDNVHKLDAPPRSSER